MTHLDELEAYARALEDETRQLKAENQRLRGEIERYEREGFRTYRSTVPARDFVARNT